MVIRLHSEARGIRPLPWTEQISSAQPPEEKFIDSVDDQFKSFNLPFITTYEFAPQSGEQWSKDERRIGLNRVYRLILKKNTKIPPKLIQSIKLIPEVEYARSASIGKASLPESNIQRIARRDGRKTDAGSRESIGLNWAHRYSRGDPSVMVAVLDTGISLKHPEYRSNLKKGFDFVDIIDGAGKFIGDAIGADAIPQDKWVGHGSHVTGIIAASGIGMPTGVVPECTILPVRVLGAMKQGRRYIGAGLVDNINSGVKFAVDKGAKIINMSLGVKHEAGDLPHQEVIDYAKRKGVTILAAAGNDGSNMIYYPGGHPYVITVGAMDSDGMVAQFSTYGAHVDFIAPGTDIYSTFLADKYAFSSGTSHAAPFVAGAVALLKSYGRKKGHNISDSQAKYILKHSSDKIGRKFKDFKAGYGRLNILDALMLLDYKLHKN
jgi:subtilisin family serine protease